MWRPPILKVQMGSINPIPDCGFFCSIWLLSVLFWQATACVLVAIGAAALLWKSLRFRKQIASISFILLVLHLGNAVNFIWRWGSL
jgi:hypothetical protein